MRSLLGRWGFAVAATLLAFPVAASVDGGGRHRDDRSASPVRVATFNASLNRNVEGQLIADLSTTGVAPRTDASGSVDGPFPRARVGREAEAMTPSARTIAFGAKR